MPGGSRIRWQERGALAPSASTGRVRRKRIVFDVCVVPYGTGLLVPWWGGEARTVGDVLREIPLLRAFIIAFRPTTFCQADRIIMLRTAVD